MIVEKTIGNIKEYSNYEIEYIDIEWHECHKRILKKVLKDGREFGIRLSTEDALVGIKQDDVFFVEENKAYVADIALTEALVIDTLGFELMPKVCYEIGNRHAPFFKGEKEFEFYTPYEMPIKVMLEKLGVKVTVEKVKFTHNKAISSTVTGHSHSHDDGGYDGKGGKAPEKFYDENNHKHSHSHSHEHGHHHHH